MTEPRDPVEIARDLLRETLHGAPPISSIIAIAEELVRLADADNLHIVAKMGTMEQSFDLHMPVGIRTTLKVPGACTLSLLRQPAPKEPDTAPRLPRAPRKTPEPYEGPPVEVSAVEGRWERVGSSMAIRHTSNGATLRPGDPGYDNARRTAAGWDERHPEPDLNAARSIHAERQRKK